jgi:hypothetical protein
VYDDCEWRPVVGAEHYHVNEYGEVRNGKTGQILSQVVNVRGFPCVTLYAEDSRTRYFWQVNKIVAQAFLQPSYFSQETSVWHLDGDLMNCRADNLKWETRSRVLAWNEMNRSGQPRLITSRVRNNRTGEVYENAYHCAMAVGDTEESIVLKIEKGSPRYSYIGDNDL